MRRSGTVDPDLSGVTETLLIPLYNWAMESQRPDAIMKDEKAVALVTQMSYDFLFLAEKVFVYFMEAQVKSLVLRLRDHFPGADLVFDGWTPFFVWLGNRQLSSSKFAGLFRLFKLMRIFHFQLGEAAGQERL
jgi:O-methyltransferase involved in polyketide biosynthesis